MTGLNTEPRLRRGRHRIHPATGGTPNTGTMGTARLRLISVVFLLALGVRGAALVVVEPDAKPWSDGMQYVNLGGSLADGNGYRLEEGNYWPGQPTIVRAPGWPMVLSAPFRLMPPTCRLEASRIIAVAVDSLNAVLMVLLALALGAGAATALAAGLVYAVNPVMAGLCALSASEPLGIAFILFFLIVEARHGESKSVQWWFLTGFLLGCAGLVRMNWLLIAPVFALGLLRVGRTDLKTATVKAAVVCAVTLLVVAPWVARNGIVFGSMPALGGGGGETLLGGNNDLTAEIGGKCWGYIVQPGGIPGEKPLHELAGAMNELEVNRYYTRRALAWIRANPAKLPGLVFGKLFRAYVPWPRSRSPAVLVGTAFRWGVYILAACGIVCCVRKGVRIGGSSMAALLGVVLAHLAVVIVFCGVFRYVLASEILLCLPAAVVSAAAWRRLAG